MATEMITLKMDKRFLQDVDNVVRKQKYQSRTEFIREAMRDKLNTIEKDAALRELKIFRGSAKKQVDDKRLHEIREEIAKKYAKNFDISLD